VGKEGSIEDIGVICQLLPVTEQIKKEGKWSLLSKGGDRFERKDKESYPGAGFWFYQCRGWEGGLLPPLRFAGCEF